MEVVEWIIWGGACIWIVLGFLTFFKYSPVGIYSPILWYRYPVLKAIVGIVYITGMTSALLITFIWDVSKLHLLWFVPVFTVLSKVVPAWIYTGVTKLVFGNSSIDE